MSKSKLHALLSTSNQSPKSELRAPSCLPSEVKRGPMYLSEKHAKQHLTMQRSTRFKMWNVHWMSWNGRIQVGIACHMVSWTLVSKLMRYMPQSAVPCFVLPTLNMWIEPFNTKHSLWFRVCHTQQAQCGHVLFSPLVDNVWVNWRVTPHANSDEQLVFDCNIKQEVIDAGAE